MLSGLRTALRFTAGVRYVPLAFLAGLLAVALAGGCDENPIAPSVPPTNYLSMKDFALLLPDTLVDTTGVHDALVTRTFGDPEEEQFLRTAESTYPPSARVDDGTGGSIDQWWFAEFDGIKVDKHVTRGALAYYLDTIGRFQAGDFAGTIPMQASRLAYESSIEWKSSVVVGGKDYQDVYVVEIQLDWAQVCGNVCAMGFSRTRTVVLNAHGRVIRLLDPEHLTYWVS